MEVNGYEQYIFSPRDVDSPENYSASSFLYSNDLKSSRFNRQLRTVDNSGYFEEGFVASRSASGRGKYSVRSNRTAPPTYHTVTSGAGGGMPQNGNTANIFFP